MSFCQWPSSEMVVDEFQLDWGFVRRREFSCPVLQASPCVPEPCGCRSRDIVLFLSHSGCQLVVWLLVGCDKKTAVGEPGTDGLRLKRAQR